MTEQEKNQLLEEAKNRYPPGTKFKSASTNSEWISNGNFTFYSGGCFTSISTVGGHVYYEELNTNPLWAEVISKPESNLKGEDLVEGEVYCGLIKGSKRIVIFYPEAFELYELDRNNYRFKSGNSPENVINIKLATPEEKQWLEACIKADKFISKEEALKPIETKFEKDKWYKINNCWWGKYESEDNINFYGSESISSKGNYYNNSFNANKKEQNNSFILLTNLSEIQQYLPDNHVDKLPKQEVMKEESLVGRYLKALINNPTGGSQVKAGDYGKIIKVTKDNEPDYADFPNHKKYGVSHDITGKYELMPEGFTPDNIIPEYVECVTVNNHWSNIFIKGKIYKKESFATNSAIELKGEDNRIYTVTYLGTTLSFKPSSKEAFEAQGKSNDEWIPKVGEYAIMEKAGGWGFYHGNNGCLAIIEKVNPDREVYGKKTYGITGRVINPKEIGIYIYNNFTDIPIKANDKIICRKAEPHEIPNVVETNTSNKRLSNGWVVGDRVRLKMDTIPFANVKPGEIAIITDILNNNEFHVNNTNHYCGIEYWDKVETGTPGLHSKEFQVELKEEYFKYPITPKQAIKSIFDKDFTNPLNEVLELPKSSKKKTKQLIY